MQAYLSSPVGAYVLLRGLAEKAGSITNYRIGLNGTTERTATKRTGLCLMKTIDGRPTYMTIARHNRRTLVASLEDEEGLVKAAAKRRLAAVLIPLVTEYIRSQNASLATDDRVRIVFGETANAVDRGKTCILFAEDAAIHTSSTLRSGKSAFSSAVKFPPGQSSSPESQKTKARALS